MRPGQPGGVWDAMTMIIIKGIVIGFVVVLALFVGMTVPLVGRIAEWLLAPGYALPEAYWGAAHDPIQILAAFLLNVVFYATLVSCVILLLKRKGAAQ